VAKMEKLGRSLTPRGRVRALESPRPIHDFAVMFDHFDSLPIDQRA
jgi:hypothetical protein